MGARMLDSILGIASTFDWISPVAGFMGDLMNGPSHTFLIPWASCPLNGREIGQMLRKRGVKYWGLMIVSGTLMISVRLNQARWAQHLLEQAGVPIENPLPASEMSRRSQRVSSPSRAGQRRKRRGSRSEIGGILDSVTDILNTRLF